MAKRVFISYSHDDDAHRERVLALADKLRADGIDAEIDQYHEDSPPSSGWPRWMERQLREADFVLAVCTPKYRKRFDDDEAPTAGFGVAWESGIMYAALYAFKGHNTRIIPVLVDPTHEACIPIILTVTTRLLPWTVDGYAALKRRINSTPRIVKPPLGISPSANVTIAPRGTNIAPLGSAIIPRPHELAALRAQLHLNPAAGVTRPAAATAPGGYGKTITAMLYAHEYADDYPGGRFFLRCELGNIESELAALAVHVGVDDALPDGAKAAAVKAALEAGPLALLILDNITSAEQWADAKLQALLPTKNTHLLITSRATDLPGVAQVTIGRLTNQQATAMLAYFRPDANDPANAKAVGDAIEQVEGLAVAIAAMGAYMQLTPGATWARFAKDLVKGQLSHLQAGEPRIAAHIGYTQAITDVLDAAIFALPKPEQQALAYAAQLPADMVPRPWLAALLKADTTITLQPKLGTHEDQAEAVIEHLLALKLLRPAGEDERLLSMHRAHRAQMRFRAERDKAAQTTLITAIAAHAAGRSGTIVFGEGAGIAGTIDSPAALTEQALRWELTPLASVCQDLWHTGYPGEASRIGLWLAPVLAHLSRYTDAAACLRLGAEYDAAVEEALGHEDLAHCYSSLAMVLMSQGHLSRARELMESAIKINAMHFAPDHPTFAIRFSNHAMILHSLGDFAGARSQMDRAIAIQSKYKPLDDSSFAIKFSNLALIQQAQGDLLGAKASIQLSIEIDAKHASGNGKSLAAKKINLGTIQRAEGDISGAILSWQEGLANLAKCFLPDDPHFAISYANLALIQLELGNHHKAQGDIASAHREYASARASILYAIEIDIKHFPLDHPNFATRYFNLAGIDYAEGNTAAACENLRKALSIATSHFDEDHPLVKGIRSWIEGIGCKN